MEILKIIKEPEKLFVDTSVDTNFLFIEGQMYGFFGSDIEIVKIHVPEKWTY